MKIKELLSDKTKWTRLTRARDVHRRPVSSLSDEAVCWCLEGAVIKCYDYDRNDIIFKKIWTEIGKPAIGFWNDSHSFKEVKALVNKLDI